MGTGRREQYIYVMDCGDFCKIGRAIDPQKRLCSIRGSCPYEVVLRHVSSRPIPIAVAKGIERALHRFFKHKRHRNEWFRYAAHCRHRIVSMIEEDVADYYERLKWAEIQRAELNALMAVGTDA